MASGATADHCDGGWVIVFDEPLVTQLLVDYRFSMRLEGGGLIVVEEPFQLTTPDGMALVPPGEAVFEVGVALPLFNQRVEAIRAHDNGRLRVGFESGWTIDVPVNVGYENWQVIAPDGEEWVGLPGGAVAHLPPA